MPYFDYNATTPLRAEAREAWVRASAEAWENPSSPHRAGTRVKVRFQAVRERLAALAEIDAERLVFTRGATESLDLALAVAVARLGVGEMIAVSPTEHPAAIEAARRHGGERLRWLPVTPAGVVTPAAVEAALVEGARVVVVMAANNETGIIQPWAEIAARVRAARGSYVCDATQWLGKLPAAGLGAVDWVAAAAHKLGGPKGVGVLVRPGGVVDFPIHAGTADFPGVAALAAAWVAAETGEVWQETERLRWRAEFERELATVVPGVRVMGEGAERLWNTVTAVMPVGESHRWVARLDRRECAVGSGAACATGKAGGSSGLRAVGLSEDELKRVLRFSAGWATTREDWEKLAAALAATLVEVTPAAWVVTN